MNLEESVANSNGKGQDLLFPMKVSKNEKDFPLGFGVAKERQATRSLPTGSR